jgi:hypothetical protein
MALKFGTEYKILAVFLTNGLNGLNQFRLASLKRRKGPYKFIFLPSVGPPVNHM